jgi:hypothetical protein
MITNIPQRFKIKRVVASVIVPLDADELAQERKARWRENNRGRERDRQRSPEYRRRRRAREKAASAPVKRAEQRRRIKKNHRPFIAIDTEGMNFPGEDAIMSKKIENARGVQEAVEDTYPDHRLILVGAGGWRRTHSATSLSDNPRLSPTEGTETEFHWLGTDDKRPLSSEELLDFLTSLPAKYGPAQGYPDGVKFVSFAFNYDVTMILHDLPYAKVREIAWRKRFGTSQKIRSPVLWGGYAIDHLKGKHLRIWKLRDPDNPYRYELRDGMPIFDSRAGRLKKKLDADAYINIEDAFGF